MKTTNVICLLHGKHDDHLFCAVFVCLLFSDGTKGLNLKTKANTLKVKQDPDIAMNTVNDVTRMYTSILGKAIFGYLSVNSPELFFGHHIRFCH